jgi:hypothetical protein
MISDDQIPQEAADALFAVLVTRGSPKRAIAAAIEAWPEKWEGQPSQTPHYFQTPAIILPLGQKP